MSGSTELQTLGSSGQEEKRKENRKETGMRRRSKVGGRKALRWILLWIPICVRMQMVEAAEEEIPARREMERMLEKAPVPCLGNIAKWRRMDSCEKGRRAGEHWQKDKVKTARKRTQAPLEVEAIRRRGGEFRKKRKVEEWKKRKKKKKKKNVKYLERKQQGRRPQYLQRPGGKVARSRKRKGKGKREKGEGKRKKEEGRRKEGRRKEEGGRRKEEGGRRKEEGGKEEGGRKEGRRKKEEGRRKKEEGRRKKEEGRRKKEEGRRKKEEGRRKKEEGRRKKEKGKGKGKGEAQKKGDGGQSSKGFITSLSMFRMKRGRKEKESKRSDRRPKARQTLWKFWEVALHLVDSGTELAMCQCSRRTAENDGGCSRKCK